jgi:hypothetical protein
VKQKNSCVRAYRMPIGYPGFSLQDSTVLHGVANKKACERSALVISADDSSQSPTLRIFTSPSVFKWTVSRITGEVK